jgi:hypothetical protein
MVAQLDACAANFLAHTLGNSMSQRGFVQQKCKREISDAYRAKTKTVRLVSTNISGHHPTNIGLSMKDANRPLKD